MRTFNATSMLAVVFACSLALSVSAFAEPHAWPQFRGENAAGIAADDAPLPVEFGAEKNCLWKTPLPAGHSSPCIWGDRIFLTGYDAAAGKLETLCLDRKTGKIVWRQRAPAEKIERSHELGNPAASTAAADAERVYVYFGSYGLLCYDHAGTELWKLPLPTPSTRFGTATSPVLMTDRLLLGIQGAYLLALDPKTGEQVWKNSKLPFAPDYSLPVVRVAGDVTEVIVQGMAGMGGGMSAVDIRDGSLRWQVSGFAMQPIPTPVLGEGMVFAISFHPIGRSEDRIQLNFNELLEKYDKNGDKKLGQDEVPEKLALVSRGDAGGTGDMTFKQMWGMLDTNKDKMIDAAEWTRVDLFTGMVNNALMAFRPGDDGKITSKGIAWKAEKGLPESPSPLYYKGRLYIVKNGGILSCFNAATGKQHFQKRLEADGSYYASPVAGDGKIYTCSINGIVAVIEAADELRVVARNDLGESLMGTPAIVDGKLYIRTAGHLYAFGK
ncbi:MAG: PQQ-binding-like beta-propeller repeat protein [Planctomycetia bacterium]|nr:PQQ-binding-like beta-propeller repeat protein [Planctomycetia bacterium]